jgi:hypothetical protein
MNNIFNGLKMSMKEFIAMVLLDGDYFCFKGFGFMGCFLPCYEVMELEVVCAKILGEFFVVVLLLFQLGENLEMSYVLTPFVEILGF